MRSERGIIDGILVQYLSQQAAGQLPQVFVAAAAAARSDSLGSTLGSVLKHAQVLKQGSELIASRMHHRSRSRVSFFVLLQLTPTHQRVAEVLYYLRVQPPAAAAIPAEGLGALALRLAVCKVFTARARQGSLHVVDPSSVQHEARAFSVDNLVTVLASAHPGRNNGRLNNDAADRGKIFLMQSGNLSKM